MSRVLRSYNFTKCTGFKLVNQTTFRYFGLEKEKVSLTAD